MVLRKLAAILVPTLSGPELTAEERELIRDLGFRHFLFFKKHFQEKKQVEKLIQDLRELSERFAQGKNLLAVDQEGGRVQRIGPPLVPEFPEPFSAARRGPQEVVRFSRELAQSVKTWGLNLNLSPVLDLAATSAPAFLRGRTLGEDPEEVARLGEIFIREHLAEGVFPCAKHFPGLGGVGPDPHEELPVLERVPSEALLPFRRAVSSGVPFLMTTHLRVPSWEDKPITFSSKALEFLRQELNFEGIVLTDDLSMGALKAYVPEERILYALLSGHHLLLYAVPLTDLLPVLLELEVEARGSKVLRSKIQETYTFLNYKLEPL